MPPDIPAMLVLYQENVQQLPLFDSFDLMLILLG